MRWTGHAHTSWHMQLYRTQGLSLVALHSQMLPGRIRGIPVCTDARRREPIRTSWRTLQVLLAKMAQTHFHCHPESTPRIQVCRAAMAPARTDTSWRSQLQAEAWESLAHAPVTRSIHGSSECRAKIHMGPICTSSRKFHS